MKKLILLTFLTVLLVACGDKEKVNNPDNNNNNNNNNNTINLTHKFAEFNLEVDYSPNVKYDASFEKDVDGIEASIEDQVNNMQLRGNEAFDKLNPILEKLTFDASTPNEQVIEQVLSTFGLDSNYVEFELDVLYTDGTQKEYRLIK